VNAQSQLQVANHSSLLDNSDEDSACNNTLDTILEESLVDVDSPMTSHPSTSTPLKLQTAAAADVIVVTSKKKSSKRLSNAQVKPPTAVRKQPSVEIDAEHLSEYARNFKQPSSSASTSSTPQQSILGEIQNLKPQTAAAAKAIVETPKKKSSKRLSDVQVKPPTAVLKQPRIVVQKIEITAEMLSDYTRIFQQPSSETTATATVNKQPREKAQRKKKVPKLTDQAD